MSFVIFFFKQKTAYEVRISDWSSDVCSSDLSAIAYNDQTPGPTLRFKEGEEVTINVTNRLDESTSIHWHGLILPPEMDGVPGISFPGIEPGDRNSVA